MIYLLDLFYCSNQSIIYIFMRYIYYNERKLVKIVNLKKYIKIKKSEFIKSYLINRKVVESVHLVRL